MFDEDRLLKEVDYKAVLSGGPGGQHANKTSTKVVLSWKVAETEVFSEEQVERLLHKLKNKLTKDQVLQLASDQTRSQHKNKEILTTRFLNIVEQGLKVPRKRKKTQPTRSSKLKRLLKKKQQSEKKENRKNPLS